MKRMKEMIPYLGIDILVSYILPLFMRSEWAAMLILLGGIPGTYFLTAFVYASRRSLRPGEALIWFPFYALCSALIFFSTVFIYYNRTALIYVAFYGAMSLFGNLFGYAIRQVFFPTRRRRRRR